MMACTSSLVAGSTVELDVALGQRAAYVAAGVVIVGTTRYEQSQLIVFKDDYPASITAESDALLMLLGGQPLAGDRHVWWNFVSSDPARIEAAKRDWAAGRMIGVPGDSSRMPLPAR